MLPSFLSVNPLLAPFVTDPAQLLMTATMTAFEQLLGKGVLGGKRVMSERAVTVGMSNLLPEGAATAGTMVDSAGFGAGGRVGLGNTAGQFGWGGAAGTVAMVDAARGVRASFYTQYMPSNAYPLHADFPKAVAADMIALAKGA